MVRLSAYDGHKAIAGFPMFHTTIRGTGSYQPENRVPNDALSQFVDTNDEWIKSRSGIEERRFAAAGETNASMATKAAQRAIEASGLNANDIDIIIVATSTADTNFPAMASYVQRDVGAKPGGVAFDVNAACAGFMPALVTAEALLSKGLGKHALIIGSERMSALLDMSDRSTMVLFGDGAGALVLSAQSAEGYEPGLIDAMISSRGDLASILETKPRPNGISRFDAIHMNGREVFRHAVEKMTSATRSIVADNGYSIADVDWVIPHQANLRIITAVAEKLSIPSDRIIKTVQKQANTSAASIPLALDSAVREGKLSRGQLIAMVALGAGITWGAALMRY